MPTYEVTDPKSGRVLELTGDTPPTEIELDGLFSQYKDAPSPDSLWNKTKEIASKTLSDVGLAASQDTKAQSEGAVAAAETLGTVASGAVSWVPPAARMIGGQLNPGAVSQETGVSSTPIQRETLDQSSKAALNLMEEYSFQPKTEAGKQLTEIAMTPLTAVSDKFEEGALYSEKKYKEAIESGDQESADRWNAMIGAARFGKDSWMFALPLVFKGIKGAKNIVKESIAPPKGMEGMIPEQGKPYSITPDVPKEPLKITPKEEVKPSTTKAQEVSPVVETVEPLIQEAKKYKTADEFVKEQGEPVYHETQSKEKVEFKPQSYGSAGEHSYFYFSDKPGTLKRMIKGGASKDVSPIKQTITAFINSKNPLDLTGDISLSIPEWVKLFESKNIKLPNSIIERMAKAENPMQKRSAWQMFRSDNGVMRKALIDSGYDSIKWDEWGGKTTVALSPEQIKTKTDLTDIWNKAQEGKIEPIKEPVKPIEETVAEPIKPIIEEKQKIETPENFELKSRVYERLKKEYPEILTEDVTYEKSTRKAGIDKALELVERDPKEAFKVAMEATNAPEVDAVYTNGIMAEKALKDGNNDLYRRLIKQRSLAQTRRGQAVEAEKASITDNDTSKYVKELISARLDNLGKNYLDTVKGDLVKKSNKTKGIEAIDKQVSKAQAKMSDKMLDIREAQSLIDRLTCK